MINKDNLFRWLDHYKLSIDQIDYKISNIKNAAKYEYEKRYIWPSNFALYKKIINDSKNAAKYEGARNIWPLNYVLYNWRILIINLITIGNLYYSDQDLFEDLLLTYIKTINRPQDEIQEEFKKP